MKILIQIIVGLVLLMPLACTKKNKTAKREKGVLVIGLDSEPPTLDWNKASDTSSSFIVDNIMSGLVAYDLSDPELAIVPALANSWSSNKNATEWTFKLRDDVKWSDGKPFTAQHVVDGWVRLLDPATASNYSYFLFGIKNAKDFSTGKIKDAKKLGLKINADGDLVVSLNTPMAFFPQLLTHTSTYPIRLDVVKAHGDRWTEPENIVTLGAYNLVKWEHDKEINFERNPSYYGTPAKTAKAKVLIINDINTQINMHKSGKIDVIRRLPAVQLAHLSKTEDYRKHPILGIYYLGFNTKKAPMDNPNVRRAISMAVNRAEIVKMLNAGHEPLNGWVPKGMFGNEKELGIGFNVEEANRLMDEAGYKDRSTVPTLYYSYNTNENHKRVAENVQAQLKKNLGLKVEIRNEEWKVYLNTVKTDAPHIYRFGWLADYPDPDNFLNFMTSTSENNHTGWGSKKFDDLVVQGAKTTDKEKRRQLYKEAQKILVEQGIAVYPVYSMVSNKLVSDRVKNYPLNPMDQQPLKGVELVE